MIAAFIAAVSVGVSITVVAPRVTGAAVSPQGVVFQTDRPMANPTVPYTKTFDGQTLTYVF